MDIYIRLYPFLYLGADKQRKKLKNLYVSTKVTTFAAQNELY